MSLIIILIIYIIGAIIASILARLSYDDESDSIVYTTIDNLSDIETFNATVFTIFSWLSIAYFFSYGMLHSLDKYLAKLINKSNKNEKL